jgi:hypothetical protein
MIDDNKDTGLEIFLAKVNKIYLTQDSFKPLDTKTDNTIYYNGNKSFDKNDTRFLGAVDFSRSDYRNWERAFPFDKNNLTYPIIGETVFVIKNSNEYYWLPYTVTQYPNYREDFKTSLAGQELIIKNDSAGSTQRNYKDSVATPNQTGLKSESNPQKKKYEVKEKIKFLKPKEGDTILQGRVGNTIRFSEFFLTEDGKSSSPSIFIRNKQNGELDSKSIGTLVEEDINKDGTSIYIVSEKVKVPFKETIEKQRVGFKEYPNSTDFTGDQLFINSDRILLSSKAKEFIIFGKGNTGIITDGNFSVDAAKDIYLHNEKNIIIHSKGSNKIFINSDSGGKIYLGKDSGEGNAGAAVQKMVMGGDLVDILGKLIDQIVAMTMATPCGPSSPPTNAAAFKAIKAQLKTILSARNFLSKT